MTKRTRYFMAGAAAVLAVGLCTGLVAYYGGFPALSASRTGPTELSYVPADAAVVAYADVQAVMNSQFRQKLREAIPIQESERSEFEQKTGIDVERDIRHVIAAMGADAADGGGGIVLANGIFNQGRLEALAREHGGDVEEYRGARLLVRMRHPERPARGAEGRHHGEPALAFLGPDLLAIGDEPTIKRAIDAHHTGRSISGNEEMMRLVGDIEPGSNAWAVGRFDALTHRERLPEQVSNHLSAVKWFAAAGHVNGGVSGSLRAEARDEAAADNLRDVFRGLLALAKLQGGSDPRAAAVVQSLQLGGSGNSVVLSFTIPAEVIDLIAKAAGEGHRGQRGEAPEPPEPPKPPRPPIPNE
ncbi:MAG TPA: hypothetical protein VK886_10285 [Vicinamibacterales bacterium]|nr:hypothetical protein [Vicinamibacterales bacterium]